MSFFMPTCREASQLAMEKEMHTLSFVGKLRLRFHMAICEVCRAFGYQVEVMAKGAQECDCGPEMTDDCQSRLRTSLEQEMNNG